MSEIKTGGPAFPMQDQQAIQAYAAAKIVGIEDAAERDHAYLKARAEAIGGMTLRDYFIAHAPVEPQPWFRGVMPPPPQQRMKRPDDITKEESEELSGWSDYLNTTDMKQPRARTIAADWDRYKQEYNAWRAEQEKQRFVQWPAAWADAMLKVREAP